MTTTYSNNLGKTALNICLSLRKPIETYPIGVGMKTNSLTEKMVCFLICVIYSEVFLWLFSYPLICIIMLKYFRLIVFFHHDNI
jgi:hypothetical protein